MYAIGLDHYGGPEVLHEVELPNPEPEAGEVRVKVRAAGINPVDVMVREGAFAAVFDELDPPYVPGMDIAGTIDRIGDNVDNDFGLEEGQAVVGVVDNHGSYGGYSEYVCLPAASVIPKPNESSFPEAASFLMNALTARNALDALDLGEDSTLLIPGAAGAVGTFATALANDEGVEVVAIARPDDETFLRSVGTSAFIPRGDDAAQRVREKFPDGVDTVVDAAGLHEKIAPAVRDDGMLIALRHGLETDLERGIHAEFVNVRERKTDHKAIARLAKQVEDGLLPLRVVDVFPAAEATKAHERFAEDGLRGRVILEF